MENHFRSFTERSSRLMGNEALEILRGSSVLIAGCGGVGGAAAISLARAGVGQFLLADPGAFDPPDINRQWGADSSTMGRKKASVYSEMLAKINPETTTQVFLEGITKDNIPRLVDQADYVIDCLDVSVHPEIRLQLFESARNKGIYAITVPILGFGVIVVSSSPTGMSMLPFLKLLAKVSETNRLPDATHSVFAKSTIDALEAHYHSAKLPSTSVGVNLGASYACTEAIVALLTAHTSKSEWRSPFCLPKMLFMDSLTMRHAVLDIRELSATPES